MINSTQFENESIQFLTPNWDQLNQLAFEISQQTEKDGLKFDRIVTLAKGGWPLTRSLVDFMQVPEVASIGIKFYKGINKRYERPQIYQDIPISIQGENLLLFDDVADTGKSIEFTLNYLKNKGAKDVKTATLFYKPHSSLKPDYFAQKTTDWIVFPYETAETIKLLGPKWLKAGLSHSEIKDRLTKFGFHQECVEYYVDKLLV